MSDGLAAVGTLIQRDNGGFVTIGEVENIGGPQLSVDTAEVTNHGSLKPEIQEVAIAGGSTGDFTLTLDGETTSAIGYDDTAANVKAALEALSNVDKVLVDKPSASTWDITFMGAYIGIDLPLMTVDDTGTDGTGSVSETQAGQGPWEEMVPTVLRTGNVSLDVNFVPSDANHQMVLKDLRDGRLETWRLVFPDATSWEVEAYVVSYEPGASHSDKLTGSLSLKPTGQPTLDVSQATV